MVYADRGMRDRETTPWLAEHLGRIGLASASATTKSGTIIDADIEFDCVTGAVAERMAAAAWRLPRWIAGARCLAARRSALTRLPSAPLRAKSSPGAPVAQPDRSRGCRAGCESQSKRVGSLQAGRPPAGRNSAG
jgi:hypothetical protein